MPCPLQRSGKVSPLRKSDGRHLLREGAGALSSSERGAALPSSGRAGETSRLDREEGDLLSPLERRRSSLSVRRQGRPPPREKARGLSLLKRRDGLSPCQRDELVTVSRERAAALPC